MKKLLFLFLVFLSFNLYSQNMDYVKGIVKELSSLKYKGRGYVGKGDSITAQRLALEFKKLRLSKVGSSYFQTYSMSINTFPYEPLLKLDDIKLETTVDYIIDPSSPSIKGKYKLVHLNSVVISNKKALRTFLNKDITNSFIVFDTTGVNNKRLCDFVNNLVDLNAFHAKGIIKLTDKLIFSARTYVGKYPAFKVKKELYNKNITDVSVDIQNKFVKEHITNNLIAYIPGKKDSTIYFTAHYDHLGYLGTHRYPGALDNASGVAMVLELAKYFRKNVKRPKYNIAFILFSGEEAGLKGSGYYVENPVLPLENTMMLFNFDMVGSGNSGVSFFGMKEWSKEDILLRSINKRKSYLDNLKCTKAVASSDQYSFNKKGVKAVHVYTHGEEQFYHTPKDKFETVKFHKFSELFKLVRDYTLEKIK